MHIINSIQTDYFLKIKDNILNSSNSSSTSTRDKASTDTVSISASGQNANNNWQKIANSYDVTNISPNEIGSMVSSLIDNKLISSTDGLYLMAPRSMNLDPEVKFDLLGTARKALDFSKSHGDPSAGIKNKESEIDILETLQRLASNNA